MKIMFTTGEVAELLSLWSDAPGGYNSDFVLGEIDDRRLVARVNYRGGTRKRARIRVHVDDLVAYITAHHQPLTARARAHFTSAAA